MLRLSILIVLLYRLRSRLRVLNLVGNKIRKQYYSLIGLFFLCLYFFSIGLSVHGVEYRDDEIFYYKSTHEMIQNDNYLSPTYFDEDRFQKPFLYYWLIILSYKLFGLNWFAARFVAVFFASLSVCLTWILARQFFDRRVAYLSAAILMTTPMFFRHARNAVPDMPLNFFVLLAMVCMIYFIKAKLKARDDQSLSLDKDFNRQLFFWWVGFYGACGLGFLIKGFAVLIIPFCSLIVYTLMSRQYFLFKDMRLGRGLMIFFSITLPWFLYMIFVHGRTYLDYMIINETKDRLLGAVDGQSVLDKVWVFFEHLLFYMRVLLSIFSPWGIFLFAALPAAFVERRKQEPAFDWLLIWFFVVMLFFSSMYFVISHYMLVLSTPLAILVAWFFTQSFDKSSFLSKCMRFFQGPFVLVVMSMAFFVCAFFLTFILKGGMLAFLSVLCVYLVVLIALMKYSSYRFAPFALALMIIFVFSQGHLLGEAGITSHAILQRFAGTIQSSDYSVYRIGVGSNDIHEKEFQVYFDKRIIKAADSNDSSTSYKLQQLFFADKKPVYCLILQSDRDKYLKEPRYASFEVVQEDYIFRRRIYIDRNFFKALIQFNTKIVYDYFMEKILLLRKVS